MKVFSSLATCCVALFLSACSLTQQAQDGSGASTKAQSLTERPGNIFSTRSKKAASSDEQATLATAEAPTPAPAQAAEPPPAEDSAPAPTQEQQQAAEAILASPQQPAPAPTSAAPEEFTPAATPALMSLGNSLRMGSIVPQEEPASSSDAPPPGANAVERSGLRSPKLPGSLPMGVDGRVAPQH